MEEKYKDELPKIVNEDINNALNFDKTFTWSKTGSKLQGGRTIRDVRRLAYLFSLERRSELDRVTSGFSKNRVNNRKRKKNDFFKLALSAPDGMIVRVGTGKFANLKCAK